MFTKIDKALASALMAVVSILAIMGFIPETIIEAPWIGAVVTSISGFLATYLIPNKA